MMTDPHDPAATHPSADVPIGDVLERWPRTLAVFLRRRMACPGCAMAPFMTVAEAAACYGVPPAELLAELHRAIDGEETPAGPFAPPLPHRRAVPAE
ncbi:DUF1858 domain-containing protein [Azospirillum sp.]|uniref:DUF1858 domain-containing protein n=1 Tax=Azospirillum sp. TaxID=34012 RepID=UPI003D72F0D1